MGAIRALTLANRERGQQALGFFNSESEVFKKADDPLDVLGTDDCTEFLDRSRSNSWFVVGHTRYGTRGANIDENSHPFQYGKVVGSHNGIVDAPYEYIVDSEFVIDKLNENKSDYQKALGGEWGYWTLAWFDERLGELFVSMHDNTCGIVKFAGGWYFSSDPDHLATSLGARESIILRDGDTVSFDSKGRMKWRKKFKPTITYSYKKDGRTSGKKGQTSFTGYGSQDDWSGWTPSGAPTYRSCNTSVAFGDDDKIHMNDPERYVRDYDEEFRELWSEYAHQYEEI